MDNGIVERAIAAVSDVSGISERQMKARTRNSAVCDARGICYVLACENGAHPLAVAERLGRTRSCVITVVKHYRGYLVAGDRAAVRLYNAGRARFETMEN